jgi:hypothetical protein
MNTLILTEFSGFLTASGGFVVDIQGQGEIHFPRRYQKGYAKRSFWFRPKILIDRSWICDDLFDLKNTTLEIHEPAAWKILIPVCLSEITVSPFEPRVFIDFNSAGVIMINNQILRNAVISVPEVEQVTDLDPKIIDLNKTMKGMKYLDQNVLGLSVSILAASGHEDLAEKLSLSQLVIQDSIQILEKIREASDQEGYYDDAY